SPFFFPRYAPFGRYYYPYRPGISIGFYTGFGYGYPYYYGYPYGYYGYPYYPYAYGSYGYSPYAYGGYGYPDAGYVGARPGVAFGEVRIEGVAKDVQGYADGSRVGTVGDIDSPWRPPQVESA